VGPMSHSPFSAADGRAAHRWARGSANAIRPGIDAGPFSRRNQYFFFVRVVADPVVLWPGAYSDAPGAVEVLLFCILCPGAYSDAPGAVEVLLFCIWCPGDFVEEPEDFVLVCANAAVVSSTVVTVIKVFSISISFSIRQAGVKRNRCVDVPALSNPQRR
jgi:hypothetical protein